MRVFVKYLTKFDKKIGWIFIFDKKILVNLIDKTLDWMRYEFCLLESYFWNYLKTMMMNLRISCKMLSKARILRYWRLSKISNRNGVNWSIYCIILNFKILNDGCWKFQLELGKFIWEIGKYFFKNQNFKILNILNRKFGELNWKIGKIFVTRRSLKILSFMYYNFWRI